jgi:class 3 adenylate cyclase/CHASE2 domain-containing sensor protein
VKFKPLKLAPALIAGCVISVTCLLRVLEPDLFDRLERITYDWRVRSAQRFPSPVATNLGVVFISNQSIAALNKGLLGRSYGLYWPHHIYGRVLRELSAQGARSVAFDILFGELRPDHSPVSESPGRWPDLTNFLASLHPGQMLTTYEDERAKQTSVGVDSDDYFAWQLKRAGMAILAAEQGVLPQPLFATNALAIGDITADRDADGVLRRAKAFRIYRDWHPLFKQVEADPEYGVDLSKARIQPGKIVLPRPGLEAISVPVDADNNFALADFVGDKLPPGMPPKAKAFTDERVWHMGIVLAAQELRLDLARTELDLEHGRITFRGANGVERVLPVDADGYFHINWELTVGDSRLTGEWIEKLLKDDMARSSGQSGELTNLWQDKLVIVGSIATGNDLTDRGATPLVKDTFLVSKHWNVANSLITGRFVHPASLATELVLIALLGTSTAFLTWQLRVFFAAGGVILLALLYCATGLFLYVQYRYWVPLVLPIMGAMVVEHVSLVTYRVIFEQNERRRVKSVFSKIVSPNVVNELLEAETISLGGARREVTVLFADVRGFTELTDTSHERVETYVREHQLTGAAAETCLDESARETLNTVNRYLARVADYVKHHYGTLDKYIGDCVMAFWGAPTPNSQHALACVRAAIDAQRAIHELNQQRLEENRQLELENQARASAGLPPKSLHATLKLGTGINSGLVTVGLMGSDTHILNYTVFGREVNLASRLEGISGHGRIVISKATYQHLQRDDPALAATCIELEPAKLKGFKEPVKNYAVPWMPPDGAPAAAAASTVSSPEPK